MISIRKLAPIALAIGMSFAGVAHADPIVNFNLKDGNNNLLTTGGTGLDWASSGSGVAKAVGGFNPNVALQQGYEFDFLYQAALKGSVGGLQNMNGLDAEANGVGDAGKGYEFTIVSKMREVVLSSSVSTGGPGPNTSTAVFGLAGTPAQNRVAIYYDTAMNANTALGTGFDDGQLIALFTIDAGDDAFPTFSSFTSMAPNAGNGSARIRASLSQPGDFVDSNFLEGITSLIFGINFQSNLNYPAGDSATAGFHLSSEPNSAGLFPGYAVNLAGGDLLLQVDGNSQFTSRVPEPASIMLIGAGLMGALGATRRRSNKAKQA
ncbi:PEP-CTERM sorting domain-containing protein [Massilia yuzhufengensis]|uniref:VPLPA-CTERM protein sorting domain-containing protein n=1 Tax=Massilia yuzhufengensis TaxID=1164594 RepID=A0A1I1DM52_9BURK|nr:PEP-CTERM sorting domain-containing protein [Massilia yuzhufengensis]SFB75452.1 VPLPA-CTERM protein sorting domain-containing protein [Massilia yuzhufengensis]